MNDPFSWPNSSDSINSAGTAAQFKVTNGPEARGLRSWIVRATSSLPVPVSPRMQTRDSLAATRSSCAITRRMASPFHTISCLPRRWRKLPVLALQSLQLERIVDGEQQFVGGDRLLQEIERAQPRRPHRHFNVRLP